MPEVAGSPTSRTFLEAQVHIEETRAKVRVEKLQRQAELLGSEETTAVQHMIEAAKAPTHTVEQLVLTKLAEADPEVLQVMDLVKQGRTALEDAISVANTTGELPLSLSPQFDKIAPFFDVNQRELWQTIQTGQYLEDVAQAMRSLAESLGAPEALWSMILKADYLPAAILETELQNGETVTFIEQVGFGIELQNLLAELDGSLAAEKVRSKRLLLRSKVLSSYLADKAHFISPAILEDLIHERYDQTDPWIAGNIFETFQSLETAILENERKLSPTQKRLLAIAVGVLLGIAVTLAGGQELQTKVDSLLSQDKSEQEDAQAAEEEGGAGSGSENEQERVDGPPPIPDNSRPENSGEFPQGSVWSIEGEIPSGYLRTGVASVFYTNPYWDVRAGRGNFYTYPRESDQAVTFFVSDFTVPGQGSFPLPMPYEGYSVVSIDLGEGDYGVRMSSEGTYVVEVRSLSNPGPVRIGLGRSSAEVGDSNTPEDLSIVSLIGEVSSLPVETQQLLEDVADLPVSERADAITDYVRNHFTYSLDPQYSEYHTAQSGRGEYVRRVFAMPYGDCDVINTVNVALLRAAGIPARMAYGYMNDSSLLSTGRDSVDQGESHGWAEYYDGSEWVQADATPTRVDEYTRQRLEQRNGGGGIGGVEDLSALGDMLRIQALFMLDWLKTYGLSAGALSIVATYIMSWVGLNRSRNRQERRLQEITDKLVFSRPKIGASAMERGSIPYLVSEFVDVKNFSERKTSFGRFLTDYLTVLPLVFTNRLRNSKITKTEKALEQFAPATGASYDFYQLMAEVLPVKGEALTKRVVEYNSQSNITSHLDPFFNRVYQTASEKLNVPFHFVPEGFKYLNDRDAMMVFARKFTTKEEYLDNVVVLYYKSYVKECAKKRNGKRTQAVSFEEFTVALVPEFSVLSIFYDHLRTADEAVRRRKKS